MPNTDRVLAELLSKFGVSASELWPKLVAYVKLEWTVNFVMALVALVAACYVSVFSYRKCEEDPHRNENYFYVLIPSFITALLIGVLLCYHLSNIIIFWFPEPYVLQYLKGLVG